ncbi:type I-B CRISPR-associated protein Cas5 [Hazenella sp. IB182353]|uniref:type I-B CRISPR-associated protein Cas5b n=1 Tax=Polycladospora coralii TaxID=2771432 RepID=UPI001745F25F|nr:type I-B CRISPR-associated protein Cas5b [Polycladospora coralii]MBS7530265.1 type I-B CRISPR-associated protein Cas5 [Polycladospora coralii]
MKQAVAFELSGETAFFKKPDVNANVYFTYSHIPRIALLGLLGAISGYGGYIQQSQSIADEGETEHNRYPEFYQKLHSLRISIVPQGKRGYFPRKIQVFNNGVGYASKEEGNNLIIKEQWLEKPHWTIYIENDQSEVYQKLEDLLCNRQAVFMPYLGKNDHPARIEQPRKVRLDEIERDMIVHSLVRAVDVEFGGFKRGIQPFYYRERLPSGLDPKLNGYDFTEWIHTNRTVTNLVAKETFYRTEERCIAFY